MVMSVVGWTERSVASAYSFSWVTKEFDTRGDSWMLMSPRVRRVDDLLTVHPDFQLGGAPWERKGEGGIVFSVLQRVQDLLFALSP